MSLIKTANRTRHVPPSPPTPKYALGVSKELKCLGYSINRVNIKLAQPS